MNLQEIQLDGDGTYEPGVSVAGQVTGARIAGEIRLFWMTCGRGTEEIGIADRQSLDSNGAFRLNLPGAPYSVDGSLVSIAWGLEWVDDDGGAIAQREITVSPTGQVIQLKLVKTPKSEASKRVWGNRR